MGEYLSIRDLRPEISKSFLVRFQKRRKKQTNADRIRAMTDEELALYLEWLKDPDTLTVDYRHYENTSNVNDMLDWLKQEVIE